jgi:hypothetical protein
MSSPEDWSRGLVQRATRIVHVLSREATARGWEVRTASGSPDAYGRENWTPSKDLAEGIRRTTRSDLSKKSPKVASQNRLKKAVSEEILCL